MTDVQRLFVLNATEWGLPIPEYLDGLEREQ